MKKELLRRGQFTFYASYFHAVEGLPKCRKTEALLAIIRYGLYGEEPALTGAARSVFEALRPNLDSGRAKAAARLEKNAAEAALYAAVSPTGRK